MISHSLDIYTIVSFKTWIVMDFCEGDMVTATCNVTGGVGCRGIL